MTAAADILIIDDEVDVRDGLQLVLERAGYSVRAQGDPTETLAELGRRPADLVITDIIMPKINGVTLIEMIVKDHPATCILAISGGGNFDAGAQGAGEIITTAYLTNARRAGAVHVLAKPFDSGELLAAVAIALGTGRGPD